jgi:hypothetical protein
MDKELTYSLMPISTLENIKTANLKAKANTLGKTDLFT